MDAVAPNSSGPASPPDPPQDRPASTLPPNIAAVLHILGIVLGYGRHLLDTLHLRAASPTFTLIASCFGTARLTTICAHLNRGILRATALQRVLLARAATGRDLIIQPRRIRRDAAQPAPADLQAEPPAAPQAEPQSEQSTASGRKSRKPPPSGPDDPERSMPTLEELERQVRHRSIGRTMADICLDLGVMPGLCTREFWNQLFEILYYSSGRGIETLMAEKHRREQAFIQEQDKTIGSSTDWFHLKRDEIGQILGFFIGEPPVNPFAPPATAAAHATGPP